MTVHDLVGEAAYLMNLNVSVCYEANAACHSEIVIFDDTLLPKTTCQWDNDFVSEGNLKCLESDALEVQVSAAPTRDHGFELNSQLCFLI